MDLSNLKARNTIDIQLKHPVTGEDLAGGIVTVYAPHTKQYRKAVLTVASKQERNKTTNLEALSSDEIAKLIDQTDDASVDVLEQVIVEHDFKLNGSKVKNVRDILGNASYYWINQQLQNEINREQVFIEA